MSDVSRKFKTFCERIENDTLCADLQSLTFLCNTPAVSKSECQSIIYRGADKSLALPGRKQATATEDFDFHISYL